MATATSSDPTPQVNVEGRYYAIGELPLFNECFPQLAARGGIEGECGQYLARHIGWLAAKLPDTTPAVREELAIAIRSAYRLAGELDAGRPLDDDCASVVRGWLTAEKATGRPVANWLAAAIETGVIKKPVAQQPAGAGKPTSPSQPTDPAAAAAAEWDRMAPAERDRWINRDTYIQARRHEAAGQVQVSRGDNRQGPTTTVIRLGDWKALKAKYGAQAEAAWDAMSSRERLAAGGRQGKLGWVVRKINELADAAGDKI